MRVHKAVSHSAGIEFWCHPYTSNRASKATKSFRQSDTDSCALKLKYPLRNCRSSVCTEYSARHWGSCANFPFFNYIYIHTDHLLTMLFLSFLFHKVSGPTLATASGNQRANASQILVVIATCHQYSSVWLGSGSQTEAPTNFFVVF